MRCRSTGRGFGHRAAGLIGALYLKELDDAFAAAGFFYRRLMDDVKVLNCIFTKLRVGKGFDFLGYQVSPEGFTVSAATKARFIERAKQLYEQEKKGEENISSPLRMYVRRWVGWLRAASDVDIEINSFASDLPPPVLSLFHAELQ